MTQLKLFYAPGACSLAPHIVLEETGAAYSTVRVALAQGEQRTPEYLRVNPKGCVPALTEGDWALTENPAILRYLARRFPEARLWPDDPHPEARCAEWLAWIASTIHVAYAHVRRPERYPGDAKAIEDVVAKGKEACRRPVGLGRRQARIGTVGALRKKPTRRRPLSPDLLDLGPRPDARLRHGARPASLDRPRPPHGRAPSGAARARAGGIGVARVKQTPSFRACGFAASRMKEHAAQALNAPSSARNACSSAMLSLPEYCIAVREAAEAGDEVAVVARPLRGIRVAQASFSATERSWSANSPSASNGR